MNRWISFKFWPAAWGLKGAVYEEAEAHYYLEGEELERKLANIRHKDESKILALKLNDLDYKYLHIDAYAHSTHANQIDFGDSNQAFLNQIDIDIRYDKMSPYDGAVKKVEFEHPNAKTDQEVLKRKFALLEVEYDYGRIEKNAYEKECATLRNEPWVSFIDSGFDADKGLNGFRFELDYNQQWIEYLKTHGYIGNTDEQVLEDWFVEVCRSNIKELEPNATILDSRF